jgi:hypothetical protein
MALLRCMRATSRLHGSNKVASLTRADSRFPLSCEWVLPAAAYSGSGTRSQGLLSRQGSGGLCTYQGSANKGSPSPCIRSRGEGEAAVETAFPGAVIVRPAVMFSPDDAFLTTILRLLRSLPAYPIFGDGRTPC